MGTAVVEGSASALTSAAPAIDLIALVAAGFAVIVAAIAAIFAKRQADQTKRQADAAERALVQVQEGNRLAEHANKIAEQAWNEARRVREIEEAAEHRSNRPGIAVELAGKPERTIRRLVAETAMPWSHNHRPRSGFRLQIRSLDRDISGGSLGLVSGHHPAILGLSAGFNGDGVEISDTVQLPPITAGGTAELGIWVRDENDAMGQMATLRCDVTVDVATWTAILFVTFPESTARS